MVSCRSVVAVFSCLWLLVSTAPVCQAVPSWQVNLLNSVTLDTSGVAFTIEEMSGISLLGASETPGSLDFLVALENSGKLASLRVNFADDGSLVSATALSEHTINSTLDFEGIAVSGANQVFLSEENTPGVREFDLTTGDELRSLDVPAVFANRRSNLGFESLTLSDDGGHLWTANEEALSVDGPISSTTASTVVRLQKLEVTSNSSTPTEQYAYQVDPIHTGGFTLQRGLSELVELPDGTLLALERSFASFANPMFVSAIYEIDTSGATDISDSSFDSGLAGKTYEPVQKDLLFSGPVGASFGENLEGLTYVQLDSGKQILLGVTDNQGLLGNTLVAFELLPRTTADFDFDGDVDGRDFLIWQRNLGIGDEPGEGDATDDMLVNEFDLAAWQSEYGAMSASPVVSIAAIPEPATLLLALAGLGALALRRQQDCR